MDLAWEPAARGEMWMAETARQSARLMNVGVEDVHDRRMAAMKPDRVAGEAPVEDVGEDASESSD